MDNNSFTVWARLIKIRPSFIVKYSGNDYRVIQLALDNGYVINEKDIIKSKYLRYNSYFMQEAIKENPIFIKYYGIKVGPYDISVDSSLLDNLIKSGQYIPTIEDLKNNPDLGYSKTLINYLIENKKYEAVKYYRVPNPENGDRWSLTNGFQSDIPEEYYPTFDDLLRNKTIGYFDVFMKKIIKDHPEAIKYLRERSFDEKIIEEALKKYHISVDDVKNNLALRYSTEVFKVLLEEDANNILLYTGTNEEIFQLALKKGYIPKEKDLDNKNFTLISCIMEYLIKNVSEDLIIKYRGLDEKIFDLAYDLGFKEEKIIKYLKSIHIEYENNKYGIEKNYKHPDLKFNLSTILESKSIFLKILDKDLNLLEYYNGDDIEVFEKAFSKGYKPSKEFYRVYEKSNNFFKVAVKYYPESIKYYNPYHYDYEIIMEAIKQGVMPTEKQINSLKPYDDNIFIHLIKLKPKHIIYSGKNDVIIAWAEFNGVKIDDNNHTNWIIKKYKEMIAEFSKGSFLNMFEPYTSSNQKATLIRIAMLYGYIPTPKVLKSYFSPTEIISIIEQNNLLKQYSEEQIKALFPIYFIFPEELKQEFKKALNLNLPEEYIELLTRYRGDFQLFIDNFSKYNYFLSYMGLNQEKFMQYAFSINYDWLKDMLKIIDDEKIEEFSQVKNIFFEKFYFKDREDVSDVDNIKAFINILSNYAKYPDLCIDLMKNDIDIDSNLTDNLQFLFNRSDMIEEEQKPKSIGELTKVNELFVSKYKRMLHDVEEQDISNIKNILCNLLFNLNLSSVEDKLSVYGNTRDLRQLIFNNRNNPQLIDDITEMMIYTTMMESIIYSSDKNGLIDIAKRAVDNLEMATKAAILFDRFDDKMRALYEKELMLNLTELDFTKIDSTFLDKQMTEELGVQVFDLTDKEYCLLEHVKSEKETYEELVYGQSSAEHNTICISLGSNRMQNLYSGKTTFVFASGYLPIGNYICASTSNMCSNSGIEKNSYEVKEIYRKQRGALEISSAPENNSEVLCFREGIRFNYLLLLDGRKPTDEEIKVAKEYGLKFIKVQGQKKTIANPEEISKEHLVQKSVPNYEKNTSNLREIHTQLITTSKSKPRQIAIFSDSHGLFEPTLAILEDARKTGIDEIYSLGDNIGTGPNPRQVVELLDEYKVKSLKGNHELYATIGVDFLKEHLDKTGGYEEAKKNSDWTRMQLTEDQLLKISKSPEQLIVEIGGKKILLAHYIKDYNTDKPIAISPEIDHIFQGHIHFKSENESEHVLRGAGIGQDNPTKEKQAYYIVLTEKPEGGYSIEERYVSYDYGNMYYDIIYSDLNESDKNKIQNWAGVKR